MPRSIKEGLIDATVNGIVIGALVAGVMLLSNAGEPKVILRTTGAAMLIRFAFYMLENSDEVSLGRTGEILGLPSPNQDQKKSRRTFYLSFFKQHSLGKLI